MPKPDPQDICSGVSALLVQVARYNRVQGDRVLEAFGLHSGQELLLGALWEQDGLRPADLAARLGVTPAAITKHIARLANRNLVETKPSQDDARSVRIHLTQKGQDIRHEIAAEMRALEGRLLTSLTPKERDQLRGLLSKLLDCFRSA